jgi:hypothetical protein
MKDLLSGLTAGGWGLLAGWIIPAAVTVALLAYLVLPELPWEFADQVGELTAAEQAAALTFTAVGVGVVLSALQTPLYRLLEGYLWPASLRHRAIERHTKRRAQLREQLASAKSEDLEYGLILERLHRYPTLDGQIAPTTLGNTIRAFEAYGWDKYRLDSQTLWSELEALVPEPLRVALERARVPVDFAVSLVYLSALVGLISLVGALLGDAQVKLFLIATVALVLSPIWYWIAVVSTSEWYASVQALVNLGRSPLAQAMGLQIPETLEEERRMWEALTSFVSSEETDSAIALDSYRKGHLGSPSAKKDEGPSSHESA